MFFYSESNRNTIKGDFINNIALSCGGAMFFYNKSNYNEFNGNYINNAAHGAIEEDNGNGGAMTFKDTSKNSIFNCNFINNTARLLGGALNYRKTPYNITFNCNFINNTAKYGGGLNFFNNSYNIIFNCNFIGNNATYGGGIAIGNEEDNSFLNTPANTANAINFKDTSNSIFNCNFTNNSAEEGGAIYLGTFGIVTNCNFTNNSAEEGGAVYCGDIEVKHCVFNKNTGNNGAGVKFLNNAKIEDCIFLNSHNYTYSLIYGRDSGNLSVTDCTFLNSSSKYAPAIYANQKKVNIKNSIFKDLHAEFSGGAIILKSFVGVELENCSFINNSAVKNGGALFIDIGIPITPEYIMPVTIKNSRFINNSANFGGAIVQLEGNLTILDSDFIDNSVIYDGSAIYESSTNFKLINSRIISNKLLNEEYNGGGIYCDYSNVTIINSLFENNTKNALYSYDCNLFVENSVFNKNTEAIHGVFIYSSQLKNNTFGNDTTCLNDTYYPPTVIVEKSIKLKFTNNTINVTNLPSYFDSRDWGWVSSVKNQGDMGDCWTFGNCGALESTLIKETGIEYDLSENNMRNTMLKYSRYGLIDSYDGGISIEGLQYLTSWFGIFSSEYDPYDEIGKLSPVITTDEKIHIQDAVFIEPRENSTDNDAIKRAIMKYGSIKAGYYYSLNPLYYNKETYAYYQNESSMNGHEVSFVGWDDNYSASNFIITPPGDGAFIIKNCFGENEGDNGYMYLSYYDKSILNKTIYYDYLESLGVGYLLENQEDYTKIYQRDYTGYLDRYNNYTTFKINYQSIDNDLISGVGSYFREGENYSIEIYVNDKLKYTQNGIAPFSGYHTVKLMEEIPIKTNDDFTIIMKKEFVPIILSSRAHYEENSVFIEINGSWVDLALENKTATLKVYTKDLAIYTEDLVKIYKNDSRFEANIGVANETVIFEINGRNYTRISDENGCVSIAINLNPSNYTIKTTFNDTTVENTITVLPTLIAEDLVKYYKNASQFDISLVDSVGNPVTGVNITMNINGVFYNRTTNKNGTARLNINLPPGEYILTAIDPLTGLQMSYIITVLSTLNATDLEMKYNDGSTFNVTVLNGQGNPLAEVAVTFNVNGIFYIRHTDSNGIARLNINLPSGEYIITSEYDGLKIANTITIKD
jgi:predicted outer membrane repeat protein